MMNDAPDKELIQSYLMRVQKVYGLTEDESKSFVNIGTVSNAAYISKNQTINILTKSGEVLDVALATDLPNIKAMSKIVKKHYLCYPKELSL